MGKLERSSKKRNSLEFGRKGPEGIRGEGYDPLKSNSRREDTFKNDLSALTYGFDLEDDELEKLEKLEKQQEDNRLNLDELGELLDKDGDDFLSSLKKYVDKKGTIEDKNKDKDKNKNKDKDKENDLQI